jgi:hypothetical protein
MHRFARALGHRVLLLLFASVWTSSALAAESLSPITVGDLLRFAVIGDPLTLDWNDDIGEPGIFSPDHSKVAVVVRGGDPQRETNDATLWLYDTSELMRNPKSIKLAEFSASGAYQPIALAHWLSDNQTLVFAGTRGPNVSQIYKVNTSTHALEQLTQFTKQLIWYDVSPSGARAVSFVEPAAVTASENPQCKQYGCRVESINLYEEQRGGSLGGALGTIHNLLGGESKPLISPESGDDALSSCDTKLAGGLSPDGRYGIRLCTLKAQRLPIWWGDYTMDSYLSVCMKYRNVRCWRRGVIIDLATNQAMQWSDAPLWHPANSAPPVWIDGGRRLVLPGTFESLTGVDHMERARRTRAYAVQILDPATGSITRIGRLDHKMARTSRASWDETRQVLTIWGHDLDGAPLPPVYFQREKSRWIALKAAPVRAARNIGDSLAVEQSLNDRPVLVSVDHETGLKKTILDPNSWLATRKVGHVEAVAWNTKAGQNWHGGLYYPADYVAGQRYPLVLQTHGFEPNQYSLHGWARNYAAQALAAHGIAVLQVSEDDHDADDTPAYWAVERAGYEGAIDYLDELGIIDRNRVGTVGFSATGPTTAYLFTHSDYPIAAAAFGDTAVYGWWYYMLTGGSQQKVAQFGTSPFGGGIVPWLEQSPTFNLDRVRTPLLMWTAEFVIDPWDLYAGLRSLGKPVELWNLPTGTHDIYQASQRLRMNQLLVDWFRFWLNEEEDDSPAKAAQYARWREFRRQQERLLAQPRPPLLKWTATALP